MSISAIGSATSVPVNNIASDGDSAAVEAKESEAAKLAEQHNGGVAPKAVRASAGQSSSSSNDLAKLRRLAGQHMTASQIATQLGKSVSTVVQEAAAAGINLCAGSTSTATGNPAVGNNVNTKA
jgi:hypothetical protein